MHEIVEEKKNSRLLHYYFQNVKKTVLSTPATPTKHKIFQSPKVVKGILVRKNDLFSSLLFVNKQGFHLYFQQVWATNFFLRRAELLIKNNISF